MILRCGPSACGTLVLCFLFETRVGEELILICVILRYGPSVCGTLALREGRVHLVRPLFCVESCPRGYVMPCGMRASEVSALLSREVNL